MRRKLGVLAATLVLILAVGANSSSATTGSVERSVCGKLAKKYEHALDNGNHHRAGRLYKKMKNKGCPNLPPPATPGLG